MSFWSKLKKSISVKTLRGYLQDIDAIIPGASEMLLMELREQLDVLYAKLLKRLEEVNGR